MTSRLQEPLHKPSQNVLYYSISHLYAKLWGPSRSHFKKASLLSVWLFPLSFHSRKMGVSCFSEKKQVLLHHPFLFFFPLYYWMCQLAVFIFSCLLSAMLCPPEYLKCTLSGCQKFKGRQVVIQSESWGALMCFVYLTGAVAFRSYLHLILKSRTHRKYLSMGEEAGKAKINHAWWLSAQNKVRKNIIIKLSFGTLP